MSYVIDSYTKLLIPFNGTDGDTNPQTALTGQTVTLYGGAQIDTEYQKIGTSSLLCDSGDYATVPASADWYFGTGDFAIDFWIRPSSQNDQIYLGQYNTSSIQWYVGIITSGLQILVLNGSTIAHYRTTTMPTSEVWSHLLFSRSGTNVYIFINGVDTEAGANTAIGTNSFPDLSSKVLQMSGITSAGTKYLGSMSYVRVRKGMSVVENFIPPNEASFLGLF